ncbi:MAG TPA: AraC family transcriptional regulator [Phycisphaerae bacterium]|nr:AraC family transcriptional regulator [Phycisphaerae bacterium]
MTISNQQCDRIAAIPKICFLNAAEFTMTYTTPSNARCVKTWLIELVTKGSFSLNVENSGWQSRSKGAGIIYAPQTLGCEDADRNLKVNRPTTSLYIEFTLENDDFLYEILKANGKFAWIDDSADVLQSLMADLIRSTNSGIPYSELYTVGTFYQILSLLINSDKRGDIIVTGQPLSLMPDMVLKANLYMQKNMASPIRICDIASYVGMSESGFSHAYVRITGKSPLTVLRAFRVQAARNMLVKGNFTLQMIAELTGFSDAFHLSRYFKQVMKMSPREYLKSSR